MKPKGVILVRHGHTRDSFEESSLSDCGRTQARRLAELLDGFVCNFIWSSPSRRAAEAAHLIGNQLHAQIEIDLRLREFDVGPSPTADYPAAVARAFAGHTNSHANGESILDVSSRVDSFLSGQFDRPEELVVAVTHGICLAVALAGKLCCDPAQVWPCLRPGDAFCLPSKRAAGDPLACLLFRSAAHTLTVDSSRHHVVHRLPHSQP